LFWMTLVYKKSGISTLAISVRMILNLYQVYMHDMAVGTPIQFKGHAVICG